MCGAVGDCVASNMVSARKSVRRTTESSFKPVRRLYIPGDFFRIFFYQSRGVAKDKTKTAVIDQYKSKIDVFVYSFVGGGGKGQLR